MSIPVIIRWFPSTGNEQAIAAAQTTTANNQSLVLKSSVASLPQGPYIYDRVIRKISILRDNTEGVATATITGIGSPVDPATGNPTQVLGLISEDLETTINDFVESINIYSQIISITIDNPINSPTAIKVGFGDSGITDYVFLDYNRKIFQTSVQLQFLNHATSSVTVYQSLTKPQVPNSDGNLTNYQPIPAFPVSSDLTDAVNNQIGTLLSPVALTWANVQVTNDDSIIFTVLQQGIT